MSFKNRTKWSPIVLGLILGTGQSFTSFTMANAQSLEDSIDAELDAASKGLNPAGAKLESNASKKPKASEPKLEPDVPRATQAGNPLPPNDDPNPQKLSPASPQKSSSAAPLKSSPAAPREPQLDDGGGLDEDVQSQGEAADLKGPELGPEQAVVPPVPSKKTAPKNNSVPYPAPVQAQESSPPVEAVPQSVAPAEPALAEPSAVASEGGQVGNDEPNLSFERRLHQIFKDEHAVSDDEWSEMVGPRAEEMYSVQAGDTLWDISTTLFGDGMFWTKIWAENGAIENPHLIAPGKGIHFIAGNESSAPSLKVTETVIASTSIKGLSTELQPEAPVYEDELGSLTSDSSDIDELAVIPRPEIPAGKASKPPTSLPGSFQNSKSRYRGKFDASGLDAPVHKSQVAQATVIPTSYLSEGLPVSVGHIDEVETGERYAAIGQNVFVQMKKPFNIGDRLSVLFPRGTVVDPHHGNLGPVVEIGGTIEIAESLSQSKNVYRAVVVYMVNPIRTNSFLTETPLPRVTVRNEGRKIDADVRIVGAEFDEDRKLVGQGSIIYLDGGHRDGIQDGDILAVQSRRGAHRQNTVYPEYRKTIGKIKIVQSLENVSTALILENSEEIRIGDRTGGPLPTSLGGVRYEAIEPLSTSQPSGVTDSPEISKAESRPVPSNPDNSDASSDANETGSGVTTDSDSHDLTLE